ncbi:MAG: hypothetical protein ACK4ND_11180, partial [Cytophagaceae bacterium]
EWSEIKYHGLIMNPKNNKKVALVSLQGKEVMLSEGQSIGEFIFLKNFTDSIQVKYKGYSKFLKK